MNDDLLVLPAAIRLALCEEARDAAPGEACGILSGRASTVVRIIPLRNCSDSPYAFFADPYEQFVAERMIEDEGLSVLALYHSHPGGSAFPSESDLALLAPWDCAQVIVAHKTGNEDAELRAYRLDTGLVREVKIVD